MDYVIWTTEEIPFQACLTFLYGFDDFYRTNFEPNCTFDMMTSTKGHMLMDPEAPENVKLTDNFENTFLMTVVSKRLKETIESLNHPFCEFKETTIFDHENQKIHAQYFIANVTLLIDAIDQEASQLKWGKVVKRVMRVRKLVLDESKLPKDAPWFRVKYFGRLIFVRRDIAEKLTDKNFTGLSWTNISDYVY